MKTTQDIAIKNYWKLPKSSKSQKYINLPKRMKIRPQHHFLYIYSLLKQPDFLRELISDGPAALSESTFLGQGDALNVKGLDMAQIPADLSSMFVVSVGRQNMMVIVCPVLSALIVEDPSLVQKSMHSLPERTRNFSI